MNLDKLKAIDLPGFLARHYGVEVRGGSARCPFHDDKDPSMSISLVAGAWLFNCHTCGAKGSVIDFVMLKEGLDIRDAALRIAELEGIPEGNGKAGREIIRTHSYCDADGEEVWQKVRFARGKPKFLCRHRDGEKWIWNLDGVQLKHLPFRYHKIKDDPAVFIVEGERDADTLVALGYQATCGPAGKDTWHDETNAVFAGKECRVCYDVGQDKAAAKVAQSLATVAKSVAILKVPLPNLEDDLTDYLEGFKTDEEKRDAVMLLLAKEERLAATEPTTLMLSTVEPKPVPWLWQDYIPLGRATLICGDPGSAKTWFLLDLASKLSRGARWADGGYGIGPAKTYYLTVEDDIADTIRPRVDSLNGDPTMISVFNPEHPNHLGLNKPEGVLRLEKELVRIGDIRLVCVDPIVDFSGDSNPNAGEEVRALLTPLIRLAAKHNFALVIVGHLNKAQAMTAIYRAGGSTSGWLGKCRAAFMIFRDKNDKKMRHVVPLKANLAPQDPSQLEFRLENGRLNIEVSKVEVDIDEQLMPERGRPPREQDEAIEWVQKLFLNREIIPTAEVEEAAYQDDISDRTLTRAKKTLGFKAVKIVESGGKTFWAWQKPSKDANVS